ncbi:MAG TPA: branched chain amino acid ABC transporter [Clostridiales bacterium UBA8153]|nr:branched chain amino acid ABC transporter [Clostridiales bacterium UBA8153]
MRWEVLAIIIGMALVTYPSRWLPVAVLRQRRLPPTVTRWLEHVPAATLSALLAPLVFAGEPGLPLPPRLLAAAAAVAVSWWRRDLTLTVIAGVLAMYLAQHW